MMADFGLEDEPSDVEALEDVLEAIKSEATRKNGPRTNKDPLVKNFMTGIENEYMGSQAARNSVNGNANGEKCNKNYCKKIWLCHRNLL